METGLGLISGFHVIRVAGVKVYGSGFQRGFGATV